MIKINIYEDCILKWTPFRFFAVLSFFVINILLLATRRSGFASVNISFIINMIFIFTAFLFLITSKKTSLFMSVFLVFFYVFFFLAPLFQVSERFFPNTMPFDESLIVKTNSVVLVFGLAFMFFRYVIKKNDIMFMARKKCLWPRKSIFVFYLSLTVLLLVFFGHELFSAFSIRNIAIASITKSERLILEKFLFSIPAFLFYYCALDTNINHRKYRWFMLVLFLFIIFLFKNPFVERRNAIGPLYLSLFFLVARNKIKTNIAYVISLFFIILFLFPLAQSITNSTIMVSDASAVIKATIADFNLNKALLSLDYDGWAEVMATIKYVGSYGLTYGKQILGVLLFFVPRSIWLNKPIGSGALVSNNMLMVEHSMWFSNLSNPFPGEGYINFGILGVVFFALVLSIVSVVCDKYQEERDMRYVFSIYVSLHMFFMLRGDLMSSFAYLIGVLFAIYYLPMMLERACGKKGNLRAFIK